MKKFLLLLAAIGMIFSACEQGGVLDEENNGNSTEQPDNGNNGDNGNSGEMIPTNEIWYTSTDGNIVTPYATDAFGANIVSNTYENGKGVIVFDAPVASIGDYAFDDCTSLTSVTIPDSVTSIGNGAFDGCTSLISATIPDSVTSIGNGAFALCTSLTSVTIPDSVTSIGEQAFLGCSSLTTFYGKFASADNRCLIVDGVLNSFAPASLTQYTIPDSVTSIGEDAFYNCTSLTIVIIPDSVTSIEYQAFSGCTSLTSVTIPNSVTSIGQYAFSNCTSLTSVTIGNSVTSIGEGAFIGCTSLKEAYCKPTTPPALSKTWFSEGVFDNNAADRKIYVPRNSVSAYKAAEYWKEYADYIEGYNF